MSNMASCYTQASVYFMFIRLISLWLVPTSKPSEIISMSNVFCPKPLN